MERAPGGSAVGGMLQSTLDRLVDQGFVESIQQGTKTDQLTSKQLAESYRGYFDDVLKTVNRSQPGHRTLMDINDPLGQALFADTMFREGRGQGPTLIQQAIKIVDPTAPKPDGMMGPDTYRRYKNLLQDQKTRKQVINALLDVRLNGEPNEQLRFKFFRP